MTTLKNDPTCISALGVVMRYKFIGMGWGQISTLKNDPACNFAPRVVTIYKLHWDGVGSNFNVEK